MMSLQAQIVLAALAVAGWIGILSLLARRRLTIEHATLWTLVLGAVFLGALFPRVQEIPRILTGAYDTLSALYFTAHLFIGGLLVYFSAQISILKRQVVRLAQELALERASRTAPPDRS